MAGSAPWHNGDHHRLNQADAAASSPCFWLRTEPELAFGRTWVKLRISLTVQLAPTTQAICCEAADDISFGWQCRYSTAKRWRGVPRRSTSMRCPTLVPAARHLERARLPRTVDLATVRALRSCRSGPINRLHRVVAHLRWWLCELLLLPRFGACRRSAGARFPAAVHAKRISSVDATARRFQRAVLFCRPRKRVGHDANRRLVELQTTRLSSVYGGCRCAQPALLNNGDTRRTCRSSHNIARGSSIQAQVLPAPLDGAKKFQVTLWLRFCLATSSASCRTADLAWFPLPGSRARGLPAPRSGTGAAKGSGPARGARITDVSGEAPDLLRGLRRS